MLAQPHGRGYSCTSSFLRLAFPLLLHLQLRFSSVGRQLRRNELSLKMLDPSGGTGTDWTGSVGLIRGLICDQGGCERSCSICS